MTMKSHALKLQKFDDEDYRNMCQNVNNLACKDSAGARFKPRRIPSEEFKKSQI